VTPPYRYHQAVIEISSASDAEAIADADRGQADISHFLAFIAAISH
jgi:hypothetical protein